MGKDVVAVIGAGGVGAAVARRLGGRVLLVADSDERTLTAAADRLARDGHKVVPQLVDVALRESVGALADTAASLGRVTHVAHSAGLAPTQAPVAEILQVDLLGTAHVLEEFARVMAPGGAGVVVGGIAAHLAPPLPDEEERALAVTPASALLSLPFLAPDVVGDQGAAYSLAKRAGVIRVRAAAATSWSAAGARLNSISPGAIGFGGGQDDDRSGASLRALVNAAGVRRHGVVEDVAEAAAFLLGPQAAFITGTDLLVDGGVLAALRHAGLRAREDATLL